MTCSGSKNGATRLTRPKPFEGSPGIKINQRCRNIHSALLLTHAPGGPVNQTLRGIKVCTNHQTKTTLQEFLFAQNSQTRKTLLTSSRNIIERGLRLTRQTSKRFVLLVASFPNRLTHAVAHGNDEFMRTNVDTRPIHLNAKFNFEGVNATSRVQYVPRTRLRRCVHDSSASSKTISAGKLQQPPHKNSTETLFVPSGPTRWQLAV